MLADGARTVPLYFYITVSFLSIICCVLKNMKALLVFATIL